MKTMKRSFGIATSFAAVIATSVIFAPAASATPSGCGDLANGQLCISGGTVGKAGTYTFTVGYARNKSGVINVRLGDQRKNDQITAAENWYGYDKTDNPGVYAERSQKHDLNSDDCIRGIMEYGGSTYITKWRCP